MGISHTPSLSVMVNRALLGSSSTPRLLDERTRKKVSDSSTTLSSNTCTLKHCLLWRLGLGEKVNSSRTATKSAPDKEVDAHYCVVLAGGSLFTLTISRSTFTGH